MIVLSRSLVERALPMRDCIEAIDRAMREVSRGNCMVPLRTNLPIPETRGKLVTMPGYLGTPRSFGLKIVAKYPRPAGDPHGSHVGMVLLFDASTGLPLAMLEGGALTEIRTAAASAVATRALARTDARVLAILGTGTQAERHAVALTLVRDIASVRIWGRTPERAEALASRLAAQAKREIRVCRSAEEAVRGADVVCTTTSSAEPVLKGEWLAPGQHLNLVGSAIPTTAEVDVECVRRARFYVDFAASAAAEAGELKAATTAGVVTADHVLGEIGAVLDGRVEGRRSVEDITLYKSLGLAAQDLAAAACAFEAARDAGLGVSVELGE